jgi:glycosyltransferase involved in cell wall biosynthesis
MTRDPAHGLVSVIVSTYEWPQALDAVLRTLFEQRDPAFEVVVADDGSGPETGRLVRRWQEEAGEQLQHAWQPDSGYRRARALNLAALAARGRYLVFIDGDCLVRSGFLRAVRRAAVPGWFLASKRLNLSAELSRRVLEEHLAVWRWSAMGWGVRAPRELVSAPRHAARPGVLLPIRDRRRPWRPRQGEFSPPYDGYGFFFGISRDDLVRVNGFDMRFEGWGGEDVDIAVRLRRAGLRCGWPGPHATILHLWHAVRKGSPTSNGALVAETRSSDRTAAVLGLSELAAEPGAQVSAKRVTASSSSSDAE